MHVRAPVASSLDFVALGNHVAEADFLEAVQSEVGLLVPGRGAVWVGWDCLVLKSETLLGGFGEALWSCGELAEEGGRVEGGEGGGWEPWRHDDGYVCMAPCWEGLGDQRRVN